MPIFRFSGQRTLIALLMLGFFLSVYSQLSDLHAAEQYTFEIEYDKAIHAKPYTGRIYIFFSQQREEPRTGPGWFNPEMFIARDVINWKPGEVQQFSSSQPEQMLAFPSKLNRMKLSGYHAQAVIRFNPHVRKIGTGEGNGYSTAQVIDDQTKKAGKATRFLVDRLVPRRTFRESKWMKLLSLRSALLSKFYQRDVHVNASVILPASYYTHPNRRYPVIYQIPGFGGTHFRRGPTSAVQEQNQQGVEYIRVMLDPSCPRGHHVFADSANNGPVGQSLITEILPQFDQQFRSIALPSARFLTGHSSGGWSSLWIMINYPKHFAGTWSTAPDPVDFTDFQQINLYREGENMYVDAAGARRPLARAGKRVVLWYRDFDQMEHVLGYGGQLHSFEAAFSPQGRDGKPLLLWNRNTGEIDREVALQWQKYDIRKILEENWKQLAPDLKGKIHLYMGEEDTFYLEGASRNLKEALAKLSDDPVIELFPGRNHSSLMNRELILRIRREMTTSFLKQHPDWK